MSPLKKTILLAGSLHRSKGLVEFLRLARQAGLEGWNFRLVGKPVWESFSAADLREVCQALRNHGNVTTHLGGLEADRDFVEEIKKAQVIFCAYCRYPFSSGIANWAAYFRRPVFAFRGGLIGHRVEQFCLGFVFKEQEGFLSQMRKVLLDYPHQGVWRRFRPQWGDYHKLHAASNLQRILLSQLQETFGNG